MPRFSIKDLMLGMTLVALGLTVDVALFKADPEWMTPTQALAAFCGGAAVIGAGLLTPIHRKAVGAAIGFVAAIILIVLFLVTISMR